MQDMNSIFDREHVFISNANCYNFGILTVIMFIHIIFTTFLTTCRRSGLYPLSTNYLTLSPVDFPYVEVHSKTAHVRLSGNENYS